MISLVTKVWQNARDVSWSCRCRCAGDLLRDCLSGVQVPNALNYVVLLLSSFSVSDRSFFADSMVRSPGPVTTRFNTELVPMQIQATHMIQFQYEVSTVLTCFNFHMSKGTRVSKLGMATRLSLPMRKRMFPHDIVKKPNFLDPFLAQNMAICG